MEMDDSILDAEKQSAFLEGMKSSRIFFSVSFMSLMGTVIILIVLACFDWANWGFVLAMVCCQIVYVWYEIKDFKYVYYHEIADNKLILYVLNLRGKKVMASFDEKEVEAFEISTKRQSIEIPHLKNKKLIIVGDLTSKELLEKKIEFKRK